jgi:hypothetical protein
MKYFLIVAGLLFSSAIFSQVLRGRVQDTQGKAISAASVFIKENRQGLIANNDGEFQVVLSPGIYHIEVLCLGYESSFMEINMTASNKELVIELKEKDFQLKTVEVRQGEDRAYGIMRQAIKKAPYYQSVVKESTYKAYLKGSGKMTDIPKIVNFISDGELEIYRDKLFIQESVSEIKFSEPNHYEQNVIAYSSTFPDKNNPENAIMIGMASLYYPMYGGTVSPLNPKAFDYYRFRYEGYDEDNGKIVNKIRIIPKLKDPKLMEGIIYIADEVWDIRHAEITTSASGITQHAIFNYYPVVDNIYLVSTCEIDWNVNIIGMKLEAAFTASIQYTDIQLNDSLIASRNNIPAVKKEKKSLEIKRENYRKTTVDSMAVKRDSLYWAETRTAVLNEEELKSYARRDTIQALTDSIANKDKNPKFKPSDLLWGGKQGNDSSLIYFDYSGLLGAFPEYNFVDGLWMGQSLTFDFKKKKNIGFNINPAAYWTSARKKLIWKTDIVFDYAPKRLGNMIASAGSKSEDFSGENGMNRLQNSIYLLAGAFNYARFYEKNYASLFNRIDIANGLQLGLGVEIANRKELVNHTTWNFFNKNNRTSPNIPNYDKDLNLEYNDLAQYIVHLKYTPEYYYRMNEGKKHYVRSRFPTLEIDYRQGIEVGWFGKNHSKFQQLELSLKQQIKLGVFTRISYEFVAGKFLNSNPFNYIDYKHFNTGTSILSFKGWKDSYVLLPYYTCSTNRKWLQAFINYDTDYLILKRLPFLQGKMFTETLQVKFLHTPDKKCYSELGYSVNLPFGMGGAGVFASFNSLKYNGTGIQLTIPLISILSKDKNKEITVSF